MTGLDDVDSIRRAYEAGATDFITKPIPWLVLSHRVRYLLRGSRSAAELRRSRERLANAQRLARMGSWHLDFASGEIEVSDELRSIVGLPQTPDAPTLEHFLARVHPEDLAALQAAAAACRGDGTPHARRPPRSSSRTAPSASCRPRRSSRGTPTAGPRASRAPRRT